MKNSSIPVASIKKLVDYLYDDEKLNFEGVCDYDGDSAAARSHIFRSVKKVAAWLERTT